VLGGDPVDHLQDDDGLAHTGATEEADLPASNVGCEQVDHLDARLEHLRAGLQVGEGGRRAVDVPAVREVAKLLHAHVEGLADDVPHVAEHPVADGHGDAPAGVDHGRTAAEAVGGLHADGPDAVLADVLGHLGGDHQVLALELDGHGDGVVDLRQ
jgi:hypothetical protein